MPDDEPVNYLQRIAEYYRVLGYGDSYRWAHFDEVPFTRLCGPLAEATIGIVTTAALFRADKGDQGPGAAYNGLAKFYSVYSESTQLEPDLRISHIAYDRDHTAASDQATYFPLKAFKKLESSGVINRVSERFYGLPTNRSQKTGITVDCVELLERCREDRLDAAVLVPNCPVCHQSVSLAARALEQAGISTVIMGCAKDIVEHVGVPRFLFNNFPLGNSAGLPDDAGSQLAIARQALEMLVSARKPRTTEQSPFVWSGQENWQDDYSNAKLLSPQQIEKRRTEFDKGKAEARSMR